MRISFRNRLIWLFWLLIGCSLLGSGLIASFLLHSSYENSSATRLMKEGELISETMVWDEERFPYLADKYGESLDIRIVIMDRQGEVLGDSKEGNQEPSNLYHLDAVQKALTRKIVEPLKDEDELYTVFPVIREDQVVGTVMIAIELATIEQSMMQVWFSLIGGFMIAFLLTGIAGARITKGVIRPIEDITQVAVDIAQRKFQRRVRVMGKDEIGRLGRAINRMAFSLQQQVETIRSSEQRLLSVIESMESGLLLVNADGQVDLVNQSFERMFDLSFVDIKGKGYSELIHPYDLRSLVKECLETKKPVRKEILLYYPREQILEASITLMQGKDPNLGVVAVFHDVTAIRRLQQHRSDFVANVSHELKTPITSIRGFTETLLDGALSDQATCREFLQIIHEESMRLQRLVGDILDLSRIESKQLRFHVTDHSASVLIASVVKTIAEQVHMKGLTLRVSVDPSLMIQVDEDGFRQILLNLLSNAMNYTPVGGEIRLGIESVGEHWALEVKDTGIGIPKEDLPRVFERFYRVDKARSRHSGGTGLGLAIVKHLVESHEGTMELTSEVGKGTQVVVLFPRNTYTSGS